MEVTAATETAERNRPAVGELSFVRVIAMGGTEAAFGIVTILSGGAVLLGGLTVLRDRLRDRTPPEKVLARRFARGEITHDEYLVGLSVLSEARELSRPE